MSYESEHVLPESVRPADVRAFVSLLGYKRGATKTYEGVRFEPYFWFDDADYRSWTGVELTLVIAPSKALTVDTRTPIARSYYDLAYQNHTIAALKRRFGGNFTTDEGHGRYLRPDAGPPPPPASGCHIAFARFGFLLIKAIHYHEARTFAQPSTPYYKDFTLIRELDPRTLANNTLVPYLVAALEDYFKSTFIALLRYSPRQESFFKGIRLQGEQLLAVSRGSSSVEEQLVETLPFQRITAICRHFDAIDPRLDLAGTLRKPYRKRRLSLFDLLEKLVVTRHNLIHKAVVDLQLTDTRVLDLIYDLDAAITRVYRRITTYHHWHFERTWFLGRRRKEPRAPTP